MIWWGAVATVVVLAALDCGGHDAPEGPRDGNPSIAMAPRGATSKVHGDADDCAIWIHPTDVSKSVIIGTDKGKANPGLFVWDLEGRELQFTPVRKPNNIDLRQGVMLGGRRMDIVVCNARLTRELKVYRVDAGSGRLTDITTASGIPTPELGEPYGLALYHRSRDGALFVIESDERGDTRNLHQYRLEPDRAGGVRATHVRVFGDSSIEGLAEGMVADDELGFLYVSDEDVAVRKYDVDPDAARSAPIASFARQDGIAGDREGLALYKCAGGTGLILLSSQGNSSVKVYRREGEPGDPNRHVLVTTLDTRGSSETDGLDVTSRALPGYPQGLLVKHNSPGRNFALYSWGDVARAGLTCGGGTGGAR